VGKDTKNELRIICEKCMSGNVQLIPQSGSSKCNACGYLSDTTTFTNAVGVKYDQEKLRYDLLPAQTIEGLVRVLTFGAKKYSPENWRKVPNATRRYYAALMRHVEAWRLGEVNDLESGLPHLSHALCCLVFLDQLGGYRNEE